LLITGLLRLVNVLAGIAGRRQEAGYVEQV
jgi:hypothetical protein